MPEPITLDGFRTDLAECLFLEPGEVDLEDSPLDSGLDSLRIVTLLERWQAAGADITFLDLAERTSFAQWWQLLTERTQGAGRADA
ncbi:MULTISPECIES: phosphopantetheine-binding protein [Streptomyces]|uniref:phosphopantetheine-binding protein n=1 Tax=Streptomyces TaxID=1883 RepID=UPI001CCC7808|nr:MULTISPECIES: phosphopantetheine-binding protein [Streptomyces]MBZ6139857.1 phosphopantetheine attachment domain protein [Streptomyces olivaceus]MBZ6166238.1 phosphopantetheine attachment domain protein [Streptomyces olivaceus]MBZ6171986.1 phosphopantetheine attachment domain protein [Streptomyces olivaceus]MBZ6183182.1 phosphopantetheine attachment domain protein [Streptomyces olivaceus]MBZ6249591.1 phosphopantetheine attachment domain protein [Streptomyces olivaceus]